MKQTYIPSFITGCGIIVVKFVPTVQQTETKAHKNSPSKCFSIRPDTTMCKLFRKDSYWRVFNLNPKYALVFLLLFWWTMAVISVGVWTYSLVAGCPSTVTRAQCVLIEDGIKKKEKKRLDILTEAQHVLAYPLGSKVPWIIIHWDSGCPDIYSLGSKVSKIIHWGLGCPDIYIRWDQKCPKLFTEA